MASEELTEMFGEYDMTGFLVRCRSFQFFCNNVLRDLFKAESGGVKDYMIEWFNLIQDNPGVCILAPRGFAKTTILGLAYPIWLAFTRRSLDIMIVSNSDKQSKRVLALIKATIENNVLLSELKPKDYQETWSANQINVASKCKIYCRPFTKSIKGERTDFVLMDEAESYENPDLFFDYIVPTLKPGGKIVLISTPEVRGLIQLIKDRDIGYVVKSYPAIQGGKSIWPEMFPMERLDNIRKVQGEQFFQKNFMLNPHAESGKSIFTAKSIFELFDKNSTFTLASFGGKVYIGCDFAISSGPTADYDCYIVVEVIADERIVLKYAETARGVPVNEKVRRLEELYDKFSATMIICDESSIGATVIDELRYKGIPVEAQSFQHRERHSLLNNLKRIIDNGLLRIPRDPNEMLVRKFAETLEIELLSIQEVTSQSSNITSYVSTGSHDDTVMALAMAVKHAKPATIVKDYWGFSK